MGEEVGHRIAQGAEVDRVGLQPLTPGESGCSPTRASGPLSDAVSNLLAHTLGD